MVDSGRGGVFGGGKTEENQEVVVGGASWSPEREGGKKAEGELSLEGWGCADYGKHERKRGSLAVGTGESMSKGGCLARESRGIGRVLKGDPGVLRGRKGIKGGGRVNLGGKKGQKKEKSGNFLIAGGKGGG